ncbi:hypothetical protein CEXT_341671 [Caerostris extrusa]|uniref:Uncharacterized protein n=1 Tax=Caerostris extrusa TaxID=172846 RepID=A0AAV4PTI5_CAEEX|nr:hypothetical protein CEXT_341671 [Caerostris extrusa]
MQHTTHISSEHVPEHTFLGPSKHPSPRGTPVLLSRQPTNSSGSAILGESVSLRLDPPRPISLRLNHPRAISLRLDHPRTLYLRLVPPRATILFVSLSLRRSFQIRIFKTRSSQGNIRLDHHRGVSLRLDPLRSLSIPAIFKTRSFQIRIFKDSILPIFKDSKNPSVFLRLDHPRSVSLRFDHTRSVSLRLDHPRAVSLGLDHPSAV